MPSSALPESHSWSSGSKPHACNCIGCCPDCGSCRTWPGHTPDYCQLLQRQAKERVALLRERGEQPKPTIQVKLTEAELELICWRLCQPDYFEIGGRWERHRTGQDPADAGFDLFQKLAQLWEDWSHVIPVALAADEPEQKIDSIGRGGPNCICGYGGAFRWDCEVHGEMVTG